MTGDFRAALFALFLLWGPTTMLADDAPPPGGIQLLEGYVHEPLQGFDSIVGRIARKDGPTIQYDIGRVRQPGVLIAAGGDFSDQAAGLPEAQRQWYKEQVLGGQTVHLAYGKDKTLYASFPESGVNFHAQVKNAEELAEVLLIVLSYPAAPQAEP